MVGTLPVVWTPHAPIVSLSCASTIIVSLCTTHTDIFPPTNTRTHAVTCFDSHPLHTPPLPMHTLCTFHPPTHTPHPQMQKESMNVISDGARLRDLIELNILKAQVTRNPRL